MATQSAPRALYQGYAIGALLLTFFGALWALLTMSALTAQQSVLLAIVVVIVAGVLSYAATRLLRAARQLPARVEPEGHAQGRTIHTWYGLVVVGEAVAIALASRLLNQARHDELIPLVVALIVGIHFLPLAALFHMPMYYLTGMVMIILAGGALIALCFKVTLGNPYAWSVVIGLGNAVILWLTALYVLSVGKQVLRV